MLYVANLAWWVSDADVEEAIRECIGDAGCGGALRTPPSFPVSAHNGKSLGYCFVDLEEPLDAQILVDNCNMPEETFASEPAAAEKTEEEKAKEETEKEASKAGKPMVFNEQKASVVFYEAPRAEPVHEPPPVQQQQQQQQQVQYSQQQQQQQGYQQQQHQQRRSGGRHDEGRRWNNKRRRR